MRRFVILRAISNECIPVIFDVPFSRWFSSAVNTHPASCTLRGFTRAGSISFRILLSADFLRILEFFFSSCSGKHIVKMMGSDVLFPFGFFRFLLLRHSVTASVLPRLIWCGLRRHRVRVGISTGIRKWGGAIDICYLYVLF